LSDEANSALSAVELATELTVAWLSNPNTRATKEDVPEFLKTMHEAVANLGGAAAQVDSEAEAPTGHVPAVTARKSLGNPNCIISMIDGKPYKTLRRHLSTNGLTPAEYRDRYGLKADYPMVAPAYSEQRRAMAKKIGLGRKPGEGRKAKSAAASTVPAAVPEPAAKPKRGRKPAAPKVATA
jgi:predicted transcriptional regulator